MLYVAKCEDVSRNNSRTLFQSQWSRSCSNAHQRRQNIAKQIIPSHQGLNGIGNKASTTSHHARWAARSKPSASHDKALELLGRMEEQGGYRGAIVPSREARECLLSANELLVRRPAVRGSSYLHRGSIEWLIA